MLLSVRTNVIPISWSIMDSNGIRQFGVIRILLKTQFYTGTQIQTANYVTYGGTGF